MLRREWHPAPLAPNTADLVGARFSRLLVTAFGGYTVRAGPHRIKYAVWLADCDCGVKVFAVLGNRLRSGHTTSCGCWQRNWKRLTWPTSKRICPACGGKKTFEAKLCVRCAPPARFWAGKFISPAVLFWAKVEKSEGCWLWTGQTDTARGGYGKFQVTTPGGSAKQRHVRAHRYAWELKYGSPPAGNLLHECDTPKCVRIAAGHVRSGTQSENIRGCYDRGRHPGARVTESQVREIRRAIKKRGQVRGTLQRLATKYGLSHGGISAIVYRRSWKHIP